MSAALSAWAWAFRVVDDSEAKLVLLGLAEQADGFGTVERSKALLGRLAVATGIQRPRVEAALLRLDALGAIEAGALRLRLCAERRAKAAGGRAGSEAP
jgi:hypothetical protein